MTHAPPHVPFTQRRFTAPRSDQTPVPGSALHPLPLHTSFIHLRPAKQQVWPPLRHYPIQRVLVQMHMRVRAAPKQCTNKTLPLWAAGAVLVLAPAVARCTSRITMPATRFR